MMFIHIGWQRTGTTWLQKNVFSAPCRGFTVIGKNSENDHKTRRMARYFCQNHPLKPIAPIKREILSWLEPEIEAANLAGKIPVITSEALVGSTYANSYNSRVIADLLFETFPDAKIFMAVREQKSMIFSHWLRYIAGGGTQDIPEYLNWHNHSNWRGYYPAFNLDTFCYDYTASYYSKKFGKDNVLVQPMEFFQKDHQGYLKNIYSFTNSELPVFNSQEFTTKSNTNHDVLNMHYLRVLNMILGYPLFNETRVHNKIREIGKKTIKKISARGSNDSRNDIKRKKLDQIQEIVSDYYNESNLNLQKYINTDISKLGYNIS